MIFLNAMQNKIGNIMILLNKELIEYDDIVKISDVQYISYFICRIKYIFYK